MHEAGSVGAKGLRRAFALELRRSKLLRGRVFLEVFAGKGALGRALRARGFGVVVVDIALGHDLKDPEVQLLLQGWIDSGVAWGLWLGTPCSSFSRARRAPENSRWPGPLRSSEHPAGLPQLKELDRQKVVEGNLLAKIAGGLRQRAQLRGLGCGEENPAQSFLWSLPSRSRLCDASVEQIVFDQCAFGRPWRGRTRVQFWNTDVGNAFAHCLCSSRGPCRFTGESHQVLTGAVNKSFRTHAKAEYPKSLAFALAASLSNAALRRSAAAKWQRTVEPVQLHEHQCGDLRGVVGGTPKLPRCSSL